MRRLARHPLIALGMIVVLAVIALVVLRLTTGAKTDTVRTRVVTVGIALPIRADIDIRLAYTADISPIRSSTFSPGLTGISPRSMSIKVILLKPTSYSLKLTIRTITMP